MRLDQAEDTCLSLSDWSFTQLCKLCEVQCPYTPREGHEFRLDFPRLVHRYQAIRWKKKGGKLSDAEISALEQWVNMGAPDPRDAVAAATGPRVRSGKFVITDADRDYWAFQPVQRPDVSAQSIDALVLAKLEEKALAMNPPTTPREQVRRAFFDLWGLPPGIEDVAAFEREPTDDAWARLIDQLLASPH